MADDEGNARIYMRPAEGEDPDAFAEHFAEAVVEMINRWRAQNGLPPLAEDDASEDAAGAAITRPGSAPGTTS